MSIPDLDNRFDYHRPNAQKVAAHEAVREAAKRFARVVDQLAPDSREKSLAITHAEDAMMWANAAIARN